MIISNISTIRIGHCVSERATILAKVTLSLHAIFTGFQIEVYLINDNGNDAKQKVNEQ